MDSTDIKHAEPHGYHAPGAPHTPGNALKVALLCVIGASFVGFMVGVRSPNLPETTNETAAANEEVNRQDGVVPAPWYKDIHQGNLSPNANYQSNLAELFESSAAPAEPRSNTGDDRMVALAQRAERRAYLGAPPVIPHPVDPISNLSCLSCHQGGWRAGDLAAPAIPHEPYASCTQCHVAQQELQASERWWLNNDFVGQRAPTQGTRAYLGAPPTIPHDTSMRSQCMSCHGPNGRDGLRTTHPERQNCVQCHALVASLVKRSNATKTSKR